MTDIVPHMRAITEWGVTTSGGMTVDQIILAGADEIDRLRDALKRVRDEQCASCRAADDFGIAALTQEGKA